MRRMMLYDRLGNPLGELAEADVFEATLREEINGEHSLTITTTRVLEKGIRMLYKDGRSKWREFSVAGVDAEHASGNRAIGTYYCVWSVQQDLQGVTVSVMPGVQSPVSAGTALDALLSTTERWARGTVTQMTTGGASMYDRSAWEALSVLVSVWGGEIDAAINVGTQSGVTSREVDLYAAQGNQTAMRRFDFGADLRSVKRTLADDPLFCRISPRGKGEQTDAGGYGRKITIESVNDGKDWLEYAPMVDAAKLPDGNGGYEYPTLIVENSDCETPTDLKSWAQGVLAQYCTPRVTYEVDVVQAGVEGVDVTGVSLGDAVQVVDRKFGGDGVRVQGRVRSITTDLLNERDIKIVIGDSKESISSKFASVDKSLAAVNNDLAVMSTADYIDALLDRINTEINATGGYTYITEGQGIRTYDTAVSDPLVGSEASSVVEIKGGTIRIANSRTAQGEWRWRSVFTSGHIAADLVTAANITAGRIATADNSAYWDLDSGGMVLKGDIQLKTGNYSAALGSFTLPSTSRYVRAGTYKGLASEFSSSGIYLVPNASFDNLSHSGGQLIGSTGAMYIAANLNYNSSSSTESYAGIDLGAFNGVSFTSGSSTTRSTIAASVDGGITFTLWKSGKYSTYYFKLTPSSTSYPKDGTWETVGAIDHVGNWTVHGTKSRVVDTDNYGERLLYCYETPSPMFGDLGSAKLDEGGCCYVMLDDVFSETVRTDYAYQVFLQKRGEGDCWVDEKHPNYFVVRGTPNLAFDWELKAKQTDFADLRLEDKTLDDIAGDERGYDGDVVSAYEDDFNFIGSMESLYSDELAA